MSGEKKIEEKEAEAPDADAEPLDDQMITAEDLLEDAGERRKWAVIAERFISRNLPVPSESGTPLPDDNEYIDPLLKSKRDTALGSALDLLSTVFRDAVRLRKEKDDD